MKSLKTKIATVFSFICLALSMAVFGVFSAINIPNQTNGQLGYIDKTCYIQDSSGSRTFYSTIEKAYASATNGDTICVFEDISLSADFSVEKNISLMAVSSDVTLNLSGHNIVIGSGNTLVLGGGSNTLTLSSSSNNTIQNAGTLNVYGGIISSAGITNMGKLTFFGGQVDTIANTGLVTLSQSAQIKTIQTTQQTAGETDVGIFVSSNFVATSPIALSVSGTPTPGQQVAYFQESADAQNFADYFTLTNSGYFLHTSGNSLLIGQYITPPTVSGQSTFIYDNTLKTLQFSGLTSLMSVSGNTQTNAGDYTATVSLTDKTNYRWSDTRNSDDKPFSWSIDPAQLDYPTVKQDEFTYNTQAHSLVFSGLNNNLMEVSGTTSATNVGSYTAKVSLKDKQNYTWANNSTADYEIDWSIIKAQLTKPTAGTNSFTYTGDPITYTPSGYSSATMTISGNTGTNVRDYTATISIANTDNYEWTDGTTTPVSLTWHITPKTLTKPTISGGPFTYDGNVKSVTINGFDANTMNREQYSATNAGTYTARVSLKDKVNYTWADGTTNDVTYSWTINKRQLTIPTANPASYTYTGSAISVTFTNPDSAHITLGGDLTVTVVGSYTATATIKDTANNEWTDGTISVKNIVWSITKADLPTPTGLNWTISSNKSTVTANWNSVAHASSYTVKVYVGSTLALTKSGLTSTTVSYTFTASEFNNLSEGTYTFRVQAMGNSNYNDSPTATSGNLYRLVYMTNYGTSTVHARQYYTQGQSISAPSAPLRTGYNFIGWATTNTATSANLPSTARASDTYYAVWRAISYNISIDNASGTGGSINTATYNTSTSQQTRTLTNPTRAGYTFDGWTVSWTDGTHSGTPPTVNGTTLTIPANCYGNITLTANWTARNDTAYKVEHYQENLDIATPSQSNSAHWTLAATDNLTGTTGASITPSVKSYAGFTSPSTQTTTINADGSTIVRYYYTRNTYTITLSRGTGIASVSGADTYDFGKSITISATVSTGYTFSLWTSNNTTLLPNSSNASYTFNVPAGNVTLTADASVNSYTVTYNVTENGGTSGGTTAKVNYGSAVDLSKTATKSGWTFVGWNTSSTATTKLSSYTMPANNVTLYAIFSKTITASFYQLSTTSPTKVSVTIYNKNTSGSITSPALTARNGLTIVGWGNSTTATTSSLSSGASVTLSSDTTYYAVYSYTVTLSYNGNSGTGSMASQTATAYRTANATTSYYSTGAKFTLSANGFTRRGYNFSIWAQGSASGTQYAVGKSVTLTSNTTFYAVWSLITYTITFERNSGTWTSGYPAPTSYNVNSGAITLPTADNIYRTNYIFAGWYTSSNFSGNPVTSIPAGSTGNKTYYAQWTAAAVYNTTRNLGYSDLTTAIEEANAGETLDVLSNLTSTETYIVDKSLTIQANTRAVTISGAFESHALQTTLTLGGGNYNLTIDNYVIATLDGNVTVNTNTTINGSSYDLGSLLPTIIDDGVVGIVNNASGRVTINGGTVNGDNYAICNLSSGSITVTGGTITSTATASDNPSLDSAAILNIGNGSLNVTGTNTTTITGAIGIINAASGTITIDNPNATVTATGNLMYGIYHESSATVKIKEGNIVGEFAGIIASANSGNIEISGGSIVGTMENFSYGIFAVDTSIIINGGEITGYNGIYGGDNLTMTAGTINATNIGIDIDNDLTITGGTINVTGTDGTGIQNSSSGSVEISGTNAVVINAAVGIQNGSEKQTSTNTLTITNPNTTITATQTGIENNSTNANAIDISAGTITVTGTSAYGIDNATTGGFIISGGKIEASGSSAYAVNNQAGGTVEISGTAEITGQGAGVYNTSSSILNVRGGTIKSTGTGTNAIYNTGNTVVSGGTIANNSLYVAYDIYNARGSLEIKGSAVVGKVYNYYLVIGSLKLSGTPTITSINTTCVSNYSNAPIIVNGTFTPTSPIELSLSTYTNNHYVVSYSDASYSSSWASDFYLANSSYALSLYNSRYLRIADSYVQNMTTGITYTNLTNAISGADSNNADTLRIIRSLTTNTTYTINKPLTILTNTSGVYINGDFTISSPGRNFLVTLGGGSANLTINGYIDAGSYGTLDILDNVTITGGSFDKIFSQGSGLVEFHYGLAVFTAGATINVKGGTLNTTNVDGELSSYYEYHTIHNGVSAYSNIAGGTVNISGGTITSASSEGVAVYLHTYISRLNVTDGTVSATGTRGIGIYNERGIVTISGGTIQTTGTSADSIYNANGTVNISGTAQVTAVYRGIYSTGSSSNVTISGGTILTIGKLAYSIHNSNGTVNISGTALVTAMSRGIYSTGSSSNITISGGTVTANATGGRGIYNSSGIVTISGGTIQATGTDSYGIYNSSTSASSLTLSGATENAYSISGSEYDIYNYSTGRINVSGYIPSDNLDIYLNVTASDAAYLWITGALDGGMINVNVNDPRHETVVYHWYTSSSVVYSEDHIWMEYGGSGNQPPWSSAGNSLHKWNGCFDENTWVYYYDEKKKKIRRKRAKNVKFKDKLLVWNFDKGCFDFANPLFIQRTEIAGKYTQIKFSDGSYLNVIEDHIAFNVDEMYFCPLCKDGFYGCPVGTKVMKYDGSIVTIVSKKTIHKKIAYTNIITKYHMNCFTNGILTSTAFNNIHRVGKDFKFIPDDNKCYNLSLLDGISQEYIEGLRLMEYPDRVLLNSPKNAGCKSFKEYIAMKLGVQKDSD